MKKFHIDIQAEMIFRTINEINKNDDRIISSIKRNLNRLNKGFTVWYEINLKTYFGYSKSIEFKKIDKYIKTIVDKKKYIISTNENENGINEISIKIN